MYACLIYYIAYLLKHKNACTDKHISWTNGLFQLNKSEKPYYTSTNEQLNFNWPEARI